MPTLRPLRVFDALLALPAALTDVEVSVGRGSTVTASCGFPSAASTSSSFSPSSSFASPCILSSSSNDELAPGNYTARACGYAQK